MTAPQPLAPEVYGSLGELLRDALVQFKGETALIEANRRREAARYTYLQMHQAAMPIAAALQGKARVAMLMSNQSAWLLSAYAALHAGCVLVPLDYKLGPDEQTALLRHASPEVLITEYPLWRRLGDLDGIEVFVTGAPADADLGSARPLPTEAPAEPPTLVARTRDDLACIVYSSGTSGRAKGCKLSHGAYLSQLDALLQLFPMQVGHRYFSILPTNHAIDFMVGFVGPLACGATVVHQRALRPEFLIATMQRYRISHMSVVPLVLQAFERNIREKLASLPSWQQQLVDTAVSYGGGRWLKPIHDALGGNLQLLICGGAFVDPDRVQFFTDLGIPVVVGYGLTEACTVVSVNEPGRAASVGKVVPGVEVRIDNPDTNGIGEVQLRGPTVMQGYLDDDDLTEQSFDGEWLKTGDLGRFDASWHLHLVGRCKNMIVTAGGKNIYPEDVESALEALPCEEYAVFAADYLWPAALQEGGDQLVVVARDGEWSALLPALRTANRRLPEHKRLYGYVPWEEDFPRTASMKLKRGALADEIRAALQRDAIVAANPHEKAAK